jgi:serine/threonine protein kinase
MQNSLVAIKLWKEVCSSQEIDIMRYLGGCNESCLMPMVDAFASASLTAIVMPLFDCSLQQFFESQPTCTNTAHNSIACGVAKGLAHMHRKCFLHLNLHAGNVMLTDLDSDLKVCVSNFGMVASTTAPFQEPSFNHLHQRWYRAPELFMAGSLQAVGSNQRIVFDAPLSAEIKPLLGPAVDVWAFGILLGMFPTPFSLGCHPFFSDFPKEVDQSWHILSSLFAWLGVPVGDTTFLRHARERVPRGAGSMPLRGCHVSDVLTRVFVYEGRATMHNIVECLAT